MTRRMVGVFGSESKREKLLNAAIIVAAAIAVARFGTAIPGSARNAGIAHAGNVIAMQSTAIADRSDLIGDAAEAR